MPVPAASTTRIFRARRATHIRRRCSRSMLRPPRVARPVQRRAFLGCCGFAVCVCFGEGSTRVCARVNCQCFVFVGTPRVFTYGPHPHTGRTGTSPCSPVASWHWTCDRIVTPPACIHGRLMFVVPTPWVSPKKMVAAQTSQSRHSSGHASEHPRDHEMTTTTNDGGGANETEKQQPTTPTATHTHARKHQDRRRDDRCRRAAVCPFCSPLGEIAHRRTRQFS